MHTEFLTKFSTSHLTEKCSIALPLKSWDEARYVIWAVGPVRSPDTCPASLWPTRRALDSKATVFRSMCVAILRKRRVFTPGLVLRETATRSTERGRKATHWKSVAKVPKQRGWTARLRLVSPHGNAWEISARQCRSAAVQTYRRAGITIPAVSKAGPPVSAADD